MDGDSCAPLSRSSAPIRVRLLWRGRDLLPRTLRAVRRHQNPRVEERIESAVGNVVEDAWFSHCYRGDGSGRREQRRRERRDRRAGGETFCGGGRGIMLEIGGGERYFRSGAVTSAQTPGRRASRSEAHRHLRTIERAATATALHRQTSVPRPWTAPLPPLSLPPLSVVRMDLRLPSMSARTAVPASSEFPHASGVSSPPVQRPGC